MRKNILVDGAKGKIAATVFQPADGGPSLPIIVIITAAGS